MIVDEIDSCLHPMLVRYLIDLFNDPEINKNGAQLIFNTHDVSLLDQDIFRRDQIYFVEKDNKTAMSDLYSLAEFSPRKSEDIRFWTCPNCKSELDRDINAAINIINEGLRIRTVGTTEIA